MTDRTASCYGIRQFVHVKVQGNCQVQGSFLDICKRYFLPKLDHYRIIYGPCTTQAGSSYVCAVPWYSRGIEKNTSSHSIVVIWWQCGQKITIRLKFDENSLYCAYILNFPACKTIIFDWRISVVLNLPEQVNRVGVYFLQSIFIF